MWITLTDAHNNEIVLNLNNVIWARQYSAKPDSGSTIFVMAPGSETGGPHGLYVKESYSEVKKRIYDASTGGIAS